MNLAIEYMIRSGELRNQVKFPFSFLIKNNDTDEKRIIVIGESFDKKKLIVKHWFLSKCEIDQMLPPVKSFEVNYEDLYTNENVIVSGFDCFYYQDLFNTGRKQHNDEPMASIDRNEYVQCFSFIYNSKNNQNARVGRVWLEFVKVYDLKINTVVPYFSSTSNTYAQILKKEYPKHFKKWVMWCKYMLDLPNQTDVVAGELLFQKQYNDNKNVINLKKNKIMKNNDMFNLYQNMHIVSTTAKQENEYVKIWNNYYFIG